MSITGRGAITRGRTAENDLAAWLQTNGFPDAERAAHKIVDRGDIAGVPGCCVEIKHCNNLTRALRDAQADALTEAHGRRPIAVARIPRFTNPADWLAATPINRSRPLIGTVGIDFREVGPRAHLTTVSRAIHTDGGALRFSHGHDWWITTADRLFAAVAASLRTHGRPS